MHVSTCRMLTDDVGSVTKLFFNKEGRVVIDIDEFGEWELTASDAHELVVQLLALLNNATKEA